MPTIHPLSKIKEPDKSSFILKPEIYDKIPNQLTTLLVTPVTNIETYVDEENQERGRLKDQKAIRELLFSAKQAISVYDTESGIEGVVPAYLAAPDKHQVIFGSWLFYILESETKDKSHYTREQLVNWIGKAKTN